MLVDSLQLLVVHNPPAHLDEVLEMGRVRLVRGDEHRFDVQPSLLDDLVADAVDGALVRVQRGGARVRSLCTPFSKVLVAKMDRNELSNQWTTASATCWLRSLENRISIYLWGASASFELEDTAYRRLGEGCNVRVPVCEATDSLPDRCMGLPPLQRARRGRIVSIHAAKLSSRSRR